MSSRALWTRRHLIVAVAMWVLAAALLQWSWYGSSKEASLDDVEPWVALAALASLAAGLGAMVLLARAMRSVRARQQRVMTAIDRVADLIEGQLTRTSGEKVVALVHVPGTTRFHLDTCLLVQGKGAVATTRDDGHTACGVCLP